MNTFVDANGIDLTSGQVSITRAEVSIGQPPGAMTYSRSFYGAGWRDNLTGTLNLATGIYAVSVGGSSEQFTSSGGVFTSVQEEGSTLTFNSGTNIYTYTLRDGTVDTFSGAYAETAPYQASQGMLTSTVSPQGVTTIYTYETVNLCAPGGGSCQNYFRLQSVNNNLGYQLKLSYSLNNPSNSSNVAAWQTLTQVMGINNAIDYCNPAADTCTGFSTTWPSAAYSVPSGGVQTVTDSLGRVTTYSFTTGYGLFKIQTPNSATAPVRYGYSGNTISSVSNGTGTWTYNTVGSATTVTDPNGDKRIVTSATGYVSSDQDGLGNTTYYAYDGANRLTKVTAPEGNYIQYTLDGRGNATQTTSVAKSGSGLSNIVIHAGFDTTCVQPAKCNEPNSTTDANGNVTNYTYDNTYGVTLTVTPPSPTAGAVQPQTRYSYSSLYAYYKNSAGSIVAAASPVYLQTGASACQTLAASACPGTADEVKTTIAYGLAGVANNLGITATTRAAGDGSLSATSSLAYDVFGDNLTVQGPLGVAYTTRFRYDADREIVGIVAPDPDGAGPLLFPATRLTYNADGLTTLVERGTVNSQSDSDWALFAPLVQTATFFDSVGRQIYGIYGPASGAEINVSQYAYDLANRLICSTVRMNASLFGTLPSNPFGTLPSSACLPGAPGSHGGDRIQTLAYDADNRLISQTLATGVAAQATYVIKTYSNNGLTKTALDAMANLTTFTYDGFDRLSQINYPVAAQFASSSSSTDYEAYTFDGNGNILSDRRRDATALNFCYDALNRQIRKDFPGNTSTNCGLTSLSGSVFSGYDLLNRQSYARYSSTSGTGIAFTFDALGRRTSETAPSGAMTYQYDLAGDLTRITWPDAFYAGYVYDTLGRPVTINENGATSGVGVLATYGYDNLGNRTGATYGNGAATSYARNAAGQLTSLAQTFTSTAANVTLSYAQNEADQLIGRTYSNSGYISHPAAANKVYTAAGVNSYATVAGTSYAYDGRQNLTSDGTRTFTYDSENRLLTASAPTAVTLAYDPLGRLQTSAAAGATTTLLYAGAMLVAEFNGSTLLRRYVPGPDVDEPLVWYEGAGTTSRRWLAADERGSIIAWSDATGAQDALYGYGPYGEPAAWSGSRFSFTGQIMIPEAQIYDYKSRVYDPGLGRFLQTDPIGYASDLNPYAYVSNDPVNLIDPTGQYSYERICYVIYRGNGVEGPYCSYEVEDAADDSVGLGANGRGVGGDGKFGGKGKSTTVAELVVNAKKPQNTQKPNCNSVLPNGQTIGQVVQNSIANIEDAAGPYDAGGVGELGAFVATAQSNGPIDFKNNFRGSGSPAFLGAAGNFAYGAIASGIGLSQSVAEFGAGVYAVNARKATLGNPFLEDNSAASNLPSGYASGGCSR